MGTRAAGCGRLNRRLIPFGCNSKRCSVQTRVLNVSRRYQTVLYKTNYETTLFEPDMAAVDVFVESGRNAQHHPALSRKLKRATPRIVCRFDP